MLSVTDFRLSGQKRQSGDRFGLKKAVVGVTSQGKIYVPESRDEVVHSAGRVLNDRSVNIESF